MFATELILLFWPVHIWKSYFCPLIGGNTGVVEKMSRFNTLLYFWASMDSDQVLNCPLMGQDAPLCEERWTFSDLLCFWWEWMIQNETLNISIPVFAQSFSIECGICYSYRLEDSIPDQVCNDPRCGQPFHQVCLYEVCSWMTEFRIFNKTIKFLLGFWRWTEKTVNFYFTLLILNEGNIPILQ